MVLETGTHSPWISRLLTELRHEVIVAQAQKVQLITKSRRKDDRHDARTLARLARIDPELSGQVRHRSAQAQIPSHPHCFCSAAGCSACGHGQFRLVPYLSAL